MTKTTKVVNETEAEFLLKEGTAGVYRLLKTLKPGQSYKITVDPNATYREYWCAARDNDPRAIVLSSDDCQEFKEVRIKLESPGSASQDPSYTWDGDLRNGKAEATLNQGDGKGKVTQIQGDGEGEAKQIKGTGDVVVDVAKTEPKTESSFLARMWKKVTGR